MAQPKTLSWTKLTLWPGDGSSPEVFTKNVCGMTSKGFSIAGQTSDTAVPDCADPDLPAWIDRVMKSLSASVTGSGVLAEDNFAFWNTWALSGTAKNVKVVIDGQTIDGYFMTSLLLTKFELTGNQSDGKVQVSLGLDSDGVVTWVDGAP